MDDISQKLDELADRVARGNGDHRHLQLDIRDTLPAIAPDLVGGFDKRGDDFLQAEYNEKHGLGEAPSLVRGQCAHDFVEFLRAAAQELRKPMSDGQKRLWNALDGRALTARQLASEEKLNTSEETVRQWKRDLKQLGYSIEHQPGRGKARKRGRPPKPKPDKLDRIVQTIIRDGDAEPGNIPVKSLMTKYGARIPSGTKPEAFRSRIRRELNRSAHNEAVEK